MAQEQRNSETKSGISGNGVGPFLAKVISHADPTYMGALEVSIIKKGGSEPGLDGKTVIVNYLSPFYGVTSYDHIGANPASFNDTQKSYGMWFVPPDVGVTVMVIFLEGEQDKGYWIGCVPDKFTNHMVPAIASSSVLDATSAQKSRYGVSSLPVAESNRKINKGDQALEVSKFKKPVHPIAETLMLQGLLEDSIRGTSTSSARRSLPSSVFGISTPGPADRTPNAPRTSYGKKGSRSEPFYPISRLGGTMLVMDDGDDTIQRTGSPGTLGAKEAYVDVTGIKNKSQLPKFTAPASEYFKIRTRTGHQILLHNSEDLIYITNSKGTAWVELTSNGKIDVFSDDSISIHTKRDFNFRADRDINLEAGRNINIRNEFGTFKVESKLNIELVSNASGIIEVKGNLNLKSSHHIEEAGIIDMNGPSTTPATPLKTHKNIPVTDQLTTTWKDRYQVKSGMESIMKRIPMHEPWTEHENLKPDKVKPSDTDQSI